MVRVNPANIISLLTAVFSTLNFPNSPVNEHEIELKNTLADIINRAAAGTYFGTENVTSLDFESPSGDHDVFFIDDPDVPDYEDDEHVAPSYSPYICRKSDIEVDFEYKKKCELLVEWQEREAFINICSKKFHKGYLGTAVGTLEESSETWRKSYR